MKELEGWKVPDRHELLAGVIQSQYEHYGEAEWHKDTLITILHLLHDAEAEGEPWSPESTKLINEIWGAIATGEGIDFDAPGSVEKKTQVDDSLPPQLDIPDVSNRHVAFDAEEAEAK